MTPVGPHRAFAYVREGRWRLAVVPLDAETPERLSTTDSHPARSLIARDLGSADFDFAPASFGHRLIESGFIIDHAERLKADTVSGWRPTGIPDQWSTVCYPTAEVVG